MNSTQQQIEIAGVKDGIIIMKDGSYRIVLQVAATNFALKSDEEKNSIIFQYQGFLNSLHFPIEIVIRSKRLDLTPYLAKIRAGIEKQQNELIRLQTEDYIDFVGRLVTVANIMKKNFYVVVPYSTVSVQQVNLFNMIFKKQSAQTFDHVKIADADFKNSTEKLTERANIIAGGLGGLGLHCFQLSSEEIIELFYQIYNPEEATKERITNAEALISPLVSIRKDESKTAQPAADQDLGMIDNSQLIEQQRQKEADARLQASQETEVAPGANIADSSMQKADAVNSNQPEADADEANLPEPELESTQKPIAQTPSDQLSTPQYLEKDISQTPPKSFDIKSPTVQAPITSADSDGDTSGNTSANPPAA